MNPSNYPGGILIVGSDCPLGNALAARFTQAGHQVFGTTRRSGLANESISHLDLGQDLETWKCPPSVRVAILCVGISKLEACRKNPEDSFRVNVTGLTALAEKLAASGVFIIYPSTNHVFDGTIPWRKADESYSPVTEYGRQKAEAERRILGLGDAAAVIRTAKILAPGLPLFASWVEALKQGQVIQPFSDMSLAPIPLSCAVSIIQLVADLRLEGVFQASGECDISYEEAARIGARILGVSQDLVQAVPASKSGALSEPGPVHTTLSIERLISTLGVIPPGVTRTVETAFEGCVLR